MRLRHPPSYLFLLILSLGVFATGCAGGPFGETLQRSVEADSQLSENPPFGNAEESAQNTSADVQTEPQSSDLTPEQTGPKPLENTASITDPQAEDPDFIGPVRPSNLAATAAANSTAETGQAPSPTAPSFSDLTQAPAELIAYIEDLATLELISPASVAAAEDEAASQAAQTKIFQPNKPVSRREYARWLVIVNNAFHQDNPAEQIRLAVETAEPVFQDVSTSDPDFPEIQGLAEAGIIPSPLTGNTTTVTFRPDAPLNREDLILWKIPLDTRQSLPSANIVAVEQTWGFQDAAKIDPRALQAVLADFQNGEFANIRRAFGYTTLFQPDKTVTRAEAAAVLWRFGSHTEGVSAQNLLQDSRSSDHNSAFFPRKRS